MLYLTYLSHMPLFGRGSRYKGSKQWHDWDDALRVCFPTALTLLSKVSRLIDMVATREGLQNTFENTIILYV